MELRKLLSAQTKEVSTVNHERASMYWQLGNLIFEEEQQGEIELLTMLFW